MIKDDVFQVVKESALQMMDLWNKQDGVLTFRPKTTRATTDYSVYVSQDKLKCVYKDNQQADNHIDVSFKTSRARKNNVELQNLNDLEPIWKQFNIDLAQDNIELSFQKGRLK